MNVPCNGSEILRVMNFLEKIKSNIGGISCLLLSLLAIFWMGEIILPFIFALLISYLINPTVEFIQQKVKSRNLSITLLLTSTFLLVIGVFVFLGSYLVKDTHRFVEAVQVFSTENETEINTFKNNMFHYFDNAYQSETVQNQLKSLDTLKLDSNTYDLQSSFESIYSFFQSSDSVEENSVSSTWNLLYMVIYTICYTVMILYTFEYFDEKRMRYLSGINNNLQRYNGIWKDFELTFLQYFKQRLKVVLISTLVFIIAFTVLDLPGAIIIGCISGMLTYVAHFHYFSLPLVVIGCWVLSVENQYSFLLYFGIILAVYVLISILEETVFFNRIMKSVNGMNPAIILLSFTFWISIFGGFTGTLLALPLTRLVLIYLDKIFQKQIKEPIH